MVKDSSSDKNLDKGKENAQEGSAFSAFDLLKEGQTKGDKGSKIGSADMASLFRDPEGLEKSQQKFDKDFAKAMANDSPEGLQKLYETNQKQLAATQKYIADLVAKLEVNQAMV